MDWNHLRAFLETAQRGSLSAGARHLGLTQSTLSRQVAALEQQLGVTLFERVGRSVLPTQAGLALLEHARTMGAAADALALAATGSSQAVDGVVSVSASDAVAALVLPRVIARIRAAAPGVVIEVISSNALSDLRRREADIAVRHVRPQEPDLIGRLVREASAHFYASQSWVAEHGHPYTVQDALAHRFIGADRTGAFLKYLRAFGLPLEASHFCTLAENSVVAWQLVRQGLGIGAMMDEIAEATPGVVRVIDELPAVVFPVWLVTHRELHTARRIRVVFDLLAQELAAIHRG
ncbi:LysR family transcriptional regulator [Diaphorobacter sp.]|uniref:LysR family transcriptional regulator n=1 Tax=Diaphorobacter sp. TaxID=1934310 RepID=UPI00258E4FAE|nr:LysR family transcriptional regulator [Diaphorobacter sp.]